VDKDFAQIFPPAATEIDLLSLVIHREWVSDTEKLEDVYRYFEQHSSKFIGVISEGKLIGIASQSKIGFLLGSRYGFSMFGRKPVRTQMLDRHLCIRRGTPLLEVLDLALSREGDEFHEDVALLGGQGEFLGIIPMQRLVRLQSQIISEKTRLAEEQQKNLAAKNQQLFSSLHKLRQSQGRFDILFENSALGVALVEPTGEIESCNRRTELLLGITGTAAGAFLPDMMDAASREEFLQLLQRHEQLHGNGSSFQIECRLQLPDRGRRLFKFFSNWIKETGQICVLLDDITEQRQLEMKAAQEDRSTTLDTLAGGVAHEINNKLSPIVGFSELVLEDVKRSGGSAETVKYCNIIRECAIESAKIITQLLQLSRPPSTEKQCCDLRVIAEQVVSVLRFQIRQCEAELTFKLSQQEVWISADQGQIKQVIINLIINSLQALDGRQKRHVVVTVDGDGPLATLSVEDTGGGIKPDHLKRVFDPFFTTKSFGRGTGLGLSVCASIVQRHGGDIQIESEPGLGTTVKVQLPVATIVPVRKQDLENGARDLNDEKSPASRVLVVDDEEFVGCAVQESLRSRLGCGVERVANGLLAVERLQRSEFHLIISDVRMPGMDGFELYEWVQKNHARLAEHFLFITGDAGNAELHEKLNRLRAPVLRKPFTLENLVQESRRLMKTENHQHVRLIA
jgi:two-component system NtrC family sensor kinase